MKKSICLVLLVILVASVATVLPTGNADETTLTLFASVHIPIDNGHERGLAVDPVGGRVWWSDTGSSLFMVSIADILDGDPITPDVLPIGPRLDYDWYALTWDPKRDVLWGNDFFGGTPSIYTIDDDTPWTATFQFSYANLPGYSGTYLDGMGYDMVNDSLWFSEDADANVWEVSPIHDGVNNAVLFTHFMTYPNSGTVASYSHVWYTDPVSDTVRSTSKIGTNLITYSLPFPDTAYEEDMEFDTITLPGQCLLWIIDREDGDSKIEAYIIPCDKPMPVGGEIVAIDLLALLGPYLLFIVFLVGGVSLLLTKRRYQ